MIAQPTLQRDFVILEPLEARHEEEIVASVQDPSIARFMTFADLNDERSVRSWFQSALQEPAKDVGTPFAVRHAINARSWAARAFTRSISGSVDANSAAPG
jgi:hypothetical protein